MLLTKHYLNNLNFSIRDSPSAGDCAGTEFRFLFFVFVFAVLSFRILSNERGTSWLREGTRGREFLRH